MSVCVNKIMYLKLLVHVLEVLYLHSVAVGGTDCHDGAGWVGSFMTLRAFLEAALDVQLLQTGQPMMNWAVGITMSRALCS